MTVNGGLRSRLILDSLYHLIDDSLNALGWYDSGRQHLPVSVTAEPINNNEEVPLNTIGVELDSSSDTDLEVGSNATIDDWLCYVDVYAENPAIGLELSNDIRDILRRQHPSINRDRAVLDVYDYRLATPTVLFTAFITNVRVDRARDWIQLWKQNWVSLSFTLSDEGGD